MRINFHFIPCQCFFKQIQLNWSILFTMMSKMHIEQIDFWYTSHNQKLYENSNIPKMHKIHYSGSVLFSVYSNIQNCCLLQIKQIYQTVICIAEHNKQITHFKQITLFIIQNKLINSNARINIFCKIVLTVLRYNIIFIFSNTIKT